MKPNPMKQKWNPSLFKDFHKDEHDACGIVACLERSKQPTRKNIFDCIDALVSMNHRAGFINGEGDGVGIHIDIPKELWKEKLEHAGVDASIVEKEEFSVGHIFISRKADWDSTKNDLIQKLHNHELNLIFETDEATIPSSLGPIAIQENPIFWQIACVAKVKGQELTKAIFETIIDFENNDDIHVASLSQHHAVYKVMGAGDILPRYYRDLTNPLVASTMTLGHNRYSTNTQSSFFRVQPFSVLGHNGEINTIAKLRDEARMIGIPLVNEGSDSQDLSRTMETLMCLHGYSLFEVMDILFPPIVNEIKAYKEHLQDLYTYIREAWGHFAQGPAGIISRFGDEAVFSVDALGLRPLWMLEIDSSYLFSSEPGIISSKEYVNEPKPLAPGEKIGFKWHEGKLGVYEYSDYQEEVFTRFLAKLNVKGSSKRLTPPILSKTITMTYPDKIHNGQYKAFGWERDHIQLVEQMAEKGVEPIRSLGHDAPLAALDPERKNISDFIKESVAVVTNPAIDRDRETEHFSTRVIIGKRPDLFDYVDHGTILELTNPILLEGSAGFNCAEIVGQPSFDQIVQHYQKQKLASFISITFGKDESIQTALKRLADEAVQVVSSGKTFIILDDATSHQLDSYWLDPNLVTSAVDQALVKAELRRECSIILRSAAMRSLHDIVTVFGLGADAISPYYMFMTVSDNANQQPIINLYNALIKGLEKVASTIGIHELRGYGRLFSSIGLNDEIAETLNIVNFFGSKEIEFNFSAIKRDSFARADDYQNDRERIANTFRLLPRIWKSIGDVARTGDYRILRDKINELEGESPTTIRHLTMLKKSDNPISPEEVDIHVGEHDLPFVISSMSFGSQNETAFRAYAEGADRLNMVSLNGEGGEIKDMLGKYPRTRGQQIASGRFGVNAELLNSSNLLEIKIGQGAKPGEGGHLPASKVTAKIAEARNATIGSDLISPSNNHDIYSIEDLAQMIHELKTANDQARIAVKVPVVPNIGTIAVGIAKAGADIITLSGFDGGTGAARIHAIQHVGLPVEIGVKAAHNALIESGLRRKVEIWADGGIKSATDVMKVMLLGANRIGFGTLSMIAIGCTTCRGCHLDTCHVGIATQIDTVAQANEHGLRRFVPRQIDLAIKGIMNLFTAFGQELKELAASAGIKNLQDAVGRSDLLEQINGTGQLDLSSMLNQIESSKVTQIEHAISKESKQIQMAAGAEYLDASVEELNSSRQFISVTSDQRVLGSRVSCHRVRGRLDGSYRQLKSVRLKYIEGSIPGNGLGAYNSEGITIIVNGGGQDGVGKTSFGGSITILKSKGKNGQYYNGSVGKGFGYGAQKGLLIAQGNADARAGIRLSGADIIIGGMVQKPLPSGVHGNIGPNANIKGFAFEYMTNGRALVLGDPGPWICAGMTGGAVYIRHQPEMGLTKDAIKHRIAKGAKVSVSDLQDKGKEDVSSLLGKYIELLVNDGQEGEAMELKNLLANLEDNFVQILPAKEQADPSVSTE